MWAGRRLASANPMAGLLPRETHRGREHRYSRWLVGPSADGPTGLVGGVDGRLHTWHAVTDEDGLRRLVRERVARGRRARAVVAAGRGRIRDGVICRGDAALILPGFAGGTHDSGQVPLHAR